ncbi:MAG: hypothetical protein H0V53_12410 [Rubrobacter sp.]|nr:hypothetical protein [Rubrobacter sp.]
MDDRQMKQVNEAAEKFAEAIRESYQTVGEHSAEARERSTQLTQSFFESVINELERQSESSQAASRDLIEQSKKQQEAFQSLSREATNTYINFLNSVFSYYQGGPGGRSQDKNS